MNTFPKHIAFIMDGNRRWAKARSKDLSCAYDAGGRALCSVIDYFLDLEEQVTLSFFAFSKENWKRPKIERAVLFQSVHFYCQNVLRHYRPGQVSFSFIGDRSQWPEDVKESLVALERSYSEKSSVCVVIAVNYSGRWDIDQAIDKAVSVCDRDWSRYLQVATMPEPEILVRTGKQQRLSNFYLYNLAYTELYFPKIFWPEIGSDTLQDILNSYRHINRSFGGKRFANSKTILSSAFEQTS